MKSKHALYNAIYISEVEDLSMQSQSLSDELCADDPVHLKRLKETFVDIYRHSPLEIGGSIDNGQYRAASMLCHRMKGAARVIGAVEVANIADELENIFQPENGSSLANLASLLGELGRLIEGIAPASPATQIRKHPPFIDGSSALNHRNNDMTHINNFLEALIRHDGDVDIYFSLCESFLKLRLTEDEYDKLASSVDKYDFEAAYKYLHDTLERPDLHLVKAGRTPN